MTERLRQRPSLDADETDALQAIGWRQASGASSCPDSSLLLAADDGVLDDATAERVRGHVATCPTCQLLARDLALVLAEEPTEDERTRMDARIAGARITDARVTAGRSTRRAAPSVWAVVGGLAVAAGLIWFLVMPRPVPPPPETQLATSTPAPIPSVFIAGRPTIPPGDVDLAVRGEASARVSLEDQIAAALDKADRGDLATAGSELSAIVRTHARSRIAALALGAVQLRAGQHADAVTTLERARSLKADPGTDDEIDWFLGMALVRTGNRDRARTLLDGVCRHGGARSAGACAGVAEIGRNAPR